jgi:hypothetical protein
VSLQAPILRLDSIQQPPHAQDRIAAVGGTAAVRGAPVHDDLGARESLVSDAEIQIRRLGDDGLVRAPLARDGLGADARVLFVGDGGHDDPTAAVAA